MLYFILFGVIALWVLFDGLSRNMKATAILWAVGALMLGVIVLPLYLAKRPLKNGEVREGGLPWNLLKNFAVLWTIIMAVISIYVLHAAGEATSHLNNNWAMAGAGIGIAVTVGVLGAVWFFPTAGAAILGFFLKKNTVVETGPTGLMMESQSKASALSGWAGIGAASVVALVILLANAPGTKNRSSHDVSDSAEITQTAVDTAPSTASVGWQTSESSSKMDGTREISLNRKAVNQIDGLIGSYTPELRIRCSKHKTEVYVVTGQPFESIYGEFDSVRVRLKLDDAAPSAQTWSESTDREAAFASNPQKLVKQLEIAKVFLFEFTPFEKRETTVTFNTEGLKDKLEPVSDVCGLSNSTVKK
jgi:hypothetical protein